MAKKIELNYSMLIYDIETAHLKARIWRPGDQVIRHDQLLPNANKFRILTISYKFYHEKEIHTLTCGKDGLNEKKMVEEFDRLVKKADVVFGKNNYRFDDKYINTIRMLNESAPMPEWAYKCDDIESQMRKYFALPSQSLDYISNLLGQGGKIKMERQDWIDIEDYIDLNRIRSRIKIHSYLEFLCQFLFKKSLKETIKVGEIAFAKMGKYNRKDISDTENVIIKVLPYIKPRFNAATKDKKISPLACITCGSSDVERRDVVVRGAQTRMNFYCNSHKGYAGSRPCYKNVYKNWRYTGTMGA